MDDLVNCSKCSSVPYDILMMNCNHNLCTKCAVERLDHQHSIKSIVGRLFIQCEKCKAKTNLDEESIGEIQKIRKNKHYVQKVYNMEINEDKKKKVQTPINKRRSKNNSQ